MKTEKQVELVKSFLKETTVGDFELCFEFYNKFLKNIPNEDAWIILKAFYENFDKFGSKETENGGNSDWDKFETNSALKSAFATTSSIIRNLVAKSPEEDCFYKSLWETISNPVLYAKEIDAIAGIYVGTISPMIPYFKVPDFEGIGQDEYKRLTQDNYNQIDIIRFAIFGKYKQRTQVAALLIDMLNKTNDQTTQKVLLSHAFSMFEKFGTIKAKAEEVKTSSDEK